MKIANLLTTDLQKGIFSEKYYNRIEKIGSLYHYDRNDFEDLCYVKEFIRDAEIVITSWGTPTLTGELLDVCPDLKLVLHAGGTVKPIISDEFINRNIKITNAAIALGEGVAETALGFAISASKAFYPLSVDTKNGGWNENVAKRVKDFYDITVGVIGGGYVGRHMIKLLQNFHVDILLYDPTISKEDALLLGAKKAELEELLKESDVISIHAPAIPATDHMLNKENLPFIKDGAILINTARGSIINEADLIEELKKNRFFACIDVTDPEPPSKENELRYLHNVILTPHIAGAATNGLKRVALHMCEELERFHNGEELRTGVHFDELSKLA